MHEILPQLLETFRRTGWVGWTTLLFAIFLGLLAGRIMSAVAYRLSGRFKRQGWQARAAFFRSGATPAAIACVTTGISMGLAGLALTPEVGSFAKKIIAFLYTLSIGWYLYNVVDVVEIIVRRLASRTNSGLDRMVVPLVRRTLHIFLVVVFVLFTAQNIFGANISAWLAGLGVAGLAVSLAAQDSIKNLFGSITIYLDQMFVIGDQIVFDGQTGTVEDIGFRSTRLRTPEGNLAVVPNSKLVDASVVNIGRRPHIQRLLDITIPYDTPAEKIEQAVSIIKQILAEPAVAKPFDMQNFPPRVAFNELNAESLNIRVFYWYHPPNYWDFLDHAQDFHLRLIRAFQDAEIPFAFPSRKLRLAADPREGFGIRMQHERGNGSRVRSEQHGRV